MEINIIITAAFFIVFLNNLVFSKLLGNGLFAGSQYKTGPAVLSGLTVALTVILAMAVSFPLNIYISYPDNINPGWLNQTLKITADILAVSGLAGLFSILIGKLKPLVFGEMGANFIFIASNSMILGISITVSGRARLFTENLLAASISGAGFVITMAVMAGILERMEKTDIPEILKGMPISIIITIILSLVSFGVAGMFR